MTDLKEGLLLWFTNFLIKIWQVKVLIRMQINLFVIMSAFWILLRGNQLKNYTNQLPENLKKRKVYSEFKDNIWRADLADRQLISNFNKGFRFLL